MSLLETLSGAVMSGAVRTIDLTHTLDPDFPVLVLPPEFGQCQPFRIEEVSRYDERGPAWYWRNFSCNEHTGTHFDAPIHWVTGKDLPHSSVDTIDPAAFIRPACVLDFSKEVAKNADFVLTADHIKAWEKTHGAIPAGSWVLFRTDWSKRSGEEYLNLKEDGAHSPGPDAGAIRYLINERDVIGFGVDTTRALVLSQVVLSFGIPFALVPLVIFTARRDLMGELVNRKLTTAVAAIIAALIISLNVFLLYQTFFG